VLSLSLTPASTALALFRGPETLRAETVLHATGETSTGHKPDVERELRERCVRAFLEAAGVAPGSLGAIAVRADTPHAVEAGTYEIDAAMLREAGRRRSGDCAHFGALVAHAVAQEWRCPALAVDPASSDECGGDERGASSGCGRALLAMKAAARRHARAVDRPIEALRLVLVHLGAGVSLCLESGARVGDVHHAFDPASAGVDLASALARAEAGDGRASAVLHAASNQIAKVVGGLATVLEGEVDAVLVTGRLDHAGPVLSDICRRVEWIAPVFLYRDEDELLALAQGAQAVLLGEEPLKHYA
jgi:butyrate kinase